jgi:two-component system, cell cycle sensor histidine kinase and response regulator CckA
MEKNRSIQTTSWFLAIVFLLFVIGILVTGFFFYKSQQRHIKMDAQNNLMAIADLKVGQITHWRQERLIDARLAYHNAAFIRQVNEYFKTPEKLNAKHDILKLMKAFHEDAGYKTVLLLDKKGMIRLSISQYDNFRYSYEQGIFQEVLLHRQIVLSDLHQSEDAPFIHIDLMIPLLSLDRSDSTLIGVLLFCIDPDRLLFPLIQKWPTPSRTSETLLLERDGNDIVYLNELRHQKNTTLTLRLPISHEQLPASMAVRGIEGIVEGIDYRGIPVLAAIKRIPDSPWFMNAKVDQEEIYEPLRVQAWIVGSGTFLLILASGASIGFWWRNQRARFYRKQYEAQLERHAIMKHFEYLIKYANDIILLADMDGRIVEANDQACRTYGYTREAMHQLNIQHIRTPESPSEIERQMKRQDQQEGLVYETAHRRKDGTKFPVEVSSQIIRIDNAKYLQCIIRDISERKRAEEQLYNANQMLQLVFDNIPQRIFWKDKESRFLGCNRAFAFDAGYHHTSELIGKDDFAMSWNETAKLYRADDALVMETNSAKLNYEEPQNRPDGSLLWLNTSKVPLHDQTGQVIGILGMYEDITDRKQAEEALRENENKYRSLSENSLEGIGLSKENRVIYANKALLEIFGYENLKEFLSKPLLEHVAPESQSTIQEMLRKSMNGEPYEKRFTYKIIRKDGRKRDIEISTDHVRIGKEVYTQSTFRDITERKRAEEALHQSEERYRRITQAVTDYIYTVQIKDGRAVETHHGAGCIGITGYTSEEFNADPYLWYNMIDDQDRYIIQDVHQRLVAREDVSPLEHRIVRKDGARRWVMNTLVPHYDEDRKLLSYDGLVQDITERKLAEEAMRESEEQFRSLAEQSPNMIFINCKGRVMFANKRCEDIMGYTKEEFYSPDFNFMNIIALEYRGIAEKNFQRHNTGADVPSLDFALSTKSGKRLETILATQLINYNKEKAILGIITDITERKQAEEALRQTHAFNDLLIQTMPFGMNIVDEEGNILFVSKTMKDMLTVDVVDMCCWKVYKDDNQQCQDCPLKRGISFGKPDVFETTGVLDGKTFQISHVGMMYEGRKAMLEVFQDITEQKKLQQELIQSQKMLSIGTLAGGIAHDFNNILAIILGYTSILQSATTSPEKFSDGVNAIKQAVDRGAALVKQILTFARKTDVAFKPMDVSVLTRELVSMLQQTFPKTITFTKAIETRLPQINADHVQIHQILLNLCVNARDAMPNGGVITIKAHTAAGEKVRERFPTANEQRYICITVSDTGIGMEETIRNRIFDPFFTTKEKGKGTGLGLSVVYGVVQAHHGFVEVESAVGSGTTFRLYLPVQKEYITTIEAGNAKDKVLGGTETLLVVEDEELLLNMVQILLETNGYSVLTAKDGIEAVNVYSQHAQEIALVISDMGLPKLSGDGEFKKLKEINPGVKMILASGYFEPDTKTILESVGVQGFLQKPYNIEEVLAKIRKALD